MPKQYWVNEIFYSLQGEGLRAGEASIFVRFRGCNLRCNVAEQGFDCDTEFVSGRPMTAKEIIEECCALSNKTNDQDVALWVVLTGGEPGLQIDNELLAALHGAEFKVAIESNGTVDLSELDLDWITVSPKVAEHAIKQQHATEVKYVRGYGQALPNTVVEASYYLISPAFDGDQPDPRAIKWCIQLCKENPKWRLSLQQHKLLAIR